MDCDRPLIKMLLACGCLTSDLDPLTYCSTESCPIKTLSRQGLFDEEDAAKRIAARLGIQFLDLSSPAVRDRCTIQAYTTRLSSQLCFTYRMIPLYEESGHTVVAFANPLDIDAQKQIHFVLGTDLRVAIATEDRILELIARFYPPPVSTFSSQVLEYKNADLEFVSGEEIEDCNLDETVENLAPVVQLINTILIEGLRLRASDIHFDATPNGLDVRYRIDGVMQHIFDTPKRFQRPVISKLKLMAGMNIAERRMPQDGRFGIKYRAGTIDIRVSSVPTAYGEKIVARVLRSKFTDLHFSSLGMDEKLQRTLESDLSIAGRMILITGPTGSGKTTSLYTALRFLCDGTSNIETVENPIEYKIPGVNQIQINEAANLTFANCLRAILRQDPDVIMVGEIRDSETAEMALQAAQTGHLVLSTLHTNDAPSAITRLLSLGSDPFVVSTSLAGVMAQRLVRKVCPHCSSSVSAEVLERDHQLLERFGLDVSTLRQGAGCEHCRYTGYFGRVGLFSYLRIRGRISELIRTGASVAEIVTAARANGFKSLTEAALEQLRAGITDLPEVRPYLDLAEEAESQELLKPLRPVTVAAEAVVTGHKQAILLVEDDLSNRSAIASHLRAQNYRVVELDDGVAALHHLESLTPDLIVTGLGLPGIDGKQLLQRLRMQLELRHVPVIVLTSADSDENEIELLRLGADDFISRSRSPEILIRRVQRLLGGTGSA